PAPRRLRGRPSAGSPYRWPPLFPWPHRARASAASGRAERYRLPPRSAGCAPARARGLPARSQSAQRFPRLRLQVAVTMVLRPPRGVNSPTTVAPFGLAALTTSRSTRFTTFSWKMPSSRYAFRYILYDLSSRQRAAGTYRSTIFPKSGREVLWQTEVNSG